MADKDSKDDQTSFSQMVSAIQDNSHGTNVMKESIQTYSNIDGSDKKSDIVIKASRGDALVRLKQLIEDSKAKTKKAKKKVKWDFKNSPHEEFGKTLDDTFMCFIVWAKVKKDGGNDVKESYNISKAFRRLKSYAEWIEETGSELIEPALSAASVKVVLDSYSMNLSTSKDGQCIWWFDLKALDKDKIKNEHTPTETLRAFVWYAHYMMYDKDAQENGMVMVQNCAKVGFFDLLTLMPMKVSTKLNRLTIGVLPVKLAKAYVLESPGWMNTFMKFMGMFLSKKLIKRIVFLNEWSDVGKTVGEDCIPKNFGELEGQLEVDRVKKDFSSN